MTLAIDVNTIKFRKYIFFALLITAILVSSFIQSYKDGNTLECVILGALSIVALAGLARLTRNYRYWRKHGILPSERS